MFGKVENPKNERLLDLSRASSRPSRRCIVLAVWIGLYPAPFLRPAGHVGAARRRAREPAVRRRSTRECDCRRRPPTPIAGRPTRRRSSWRRCRATSDGKPLRRRQQAAGAPLMPAGISLSDFYYILPEIVLTAGALLVLIADVLLPTRAAARAGVGDAGWCSARRWCRSLPFTDTHVEVAHGLHRGRSVRALLQGRLPARRGA